MHGRRRSGAGDQAVLLRWIGGSAHSAVALVRKRRVALASDLFRELDGRPGEWRWSSGPHAELTYPSLRHLACGEARALLQGGEAVRTCCFDRDDCTLDLLLERVDAPEGSAVAMLAQDVSDPVHRAEDRLRRREAYLQQVRIAASGLSHELNHSLNLIALRIATLRADPRFEPARRALDILSRAAERAAATAARLQDAGAPRTRFRPAAAADRRRSTAQGAPGKASILLVDDEVDNLEVLEELLELEGHRVETAPSGQEALERFRQGERYDLVLCDLGMPGMSGWQVAREIRRIAPGARIWLLTGWANAISEEDPRLADVQGVLGKPVDVDQLRGLLGEPQGPSPTPNEDQATA